MFEDAAIVFKIDDRYVCGVSFCSACAANALSEGTNLCPYHNSESFVYGMNPWILFVDNDNEVKSLHIKDGIITMKEEHVACKMKTNSQCCYTKNCTVEPWTVYRFCWVQ